MDCLTETEKMVFKNHYAQMSEQERIEFRHKFTEKAGMPHPTFYMKLGSNKFRPLERELFRELLREYYANKKRILIIGKQGIGKTALAESISQLTNLPVYDELPSIQDIEEQRGIYVSNSITPDECKELNDIHVIELMTLPEEIG
jgi:shikimate kinase